MSETPDPPNSLDLKSEEFDPLKALYSPHVNLPCPSAPIYDNVSKFSSVVLKGVRIKSREEKKSEAGPSTSEMTRRFLPHQMPVRRAPPSRCQRNVLTRMGLGLDLKGPASEGPALEGPLSVLAACVRRRLRVKVYTRHASGVRGSVEAVVAAFDKHWNLALQDAREVWLRRRRPPVPALGGGDRPEARRRRAGFPPPVSVQALSGGRERCERHVGQLLLRGEHVVLVAAPAFAPAPAPAAPAPARSGLAAAVAAAVAAAAAAAPHK